MKTLPSIVFIGAGKLATQLAKALYKKDFPILQVYSRTTASAKTLAQKLHTPFTNTLEEINLNADIYIYAVKDDALATIINENPAKKGLHIHTAGSLPMSIFNDKVENFGVVYPLQTFSKERDVVFEKIPIFIEGNTHENTIILQELFSKISSKTQLANSEQRKRLHLSAVFVCNFVNHLYTIAEKLLSEAGLPFENLLPLIEETASKLNELTPYEAQTGPAVRFDKNIIENHIDTLKTMPNEQTIYKLLSESIFRYTQQKYGQETKQAPISEEK